ncbi:hypothetical protein MO973_16440 [Paenibacillus sp. TRM 82003]|uniref:hypothetical protein n=1 Tax=Kineococcus sp. TRM81007 TaxID=2925831 RepID=UPI001F591DC9|nr:hypothetical protein [Kineococcus sp. TRM81007]MCI2237607.1 hypothetical protein [Kineococcus sp. TRM81007]MCI3921821.1 hypothetical protein [Paenibacillus sp. TRM 82003]
MNGVVTRKSLKPKPELPPVDPRTLDAESLRRRQAYLEEQRQRQERASQQPAQRAEPRAMNMDEAFRPGPHPPARERGSPLGPARQKGVVPSKRKPTRRENGL